MAGEAGILQQLGELFGRQEAVTLTKPIAIAGLKKALS
jgi:hypothetical protein